MNYIELLTKEEKSILCEIITGKDFKEFFKKNEQEFSKIRKGFRAKSLTEQQALSIAIVNYLNVGQYHGRTLAQRDPRKYSQTRRRRIVS